MIYDIDVIRTQPNISVRPHPTPFPPPLPPSPPALVRLLVVGAGNTGCLRPPVSRAARPNAGHCGGWVGAGVDCRRHFAARAKGKGAASAKAAATRALGKYHTCFSVKYTRVFQCFTRHTTGDELCEVCLLLAASCCSSCTLAFAWNSFH